MEIDMKTECTTYLDMMGMDWIIHVEYEQTSKGYAGDFYDPGWDPEYQIYHIWLESDCYAGDHPRWELTGKQFGLIANMDTTHSAIIRDIGED